MGKKKKKLKDTEYVVGIDWLSVTFRNLDLPVIFDILSKCGLNGKWNFLEKGCYGYKKRYTLGTALLLFSDDRDDVHVSLPGSIVHSVDLQKLFNYSDYFSVSRIDFCYDIYFSPMSLTPRYFYDLFTAGLVVTNINTSRIIESNNGGITAYFGSAASERMLRIYDKGMEQASSDFCSGDWLRLEYQLRGKAADSITCNFSATKDDIASSIKFLMRNFVWFVQSRGDTDVTRQSVPDSLWDLFMSKLSFSVRKTDIYPIDKKSPIRSKLDWFAKQCTGTLSFIINLFGSLECFLDNYNTNKVKCLYDFFRNNPSFKNVTFEDGRFMQGDFELCYENNLDFDIYSNPDYVL